MSYTEDEIRQKAEHFGEFMLVLESGVEYDFHNLTVEYDGRNLLDREIRIEGHNHEGEHLVVDVPLEAVEHVYAHREL